MIRAQFDNTPVSVSLDYGPNPVRRWAFFTDSQEQCTTWAESRSVAKNPQRDDQSQGAIYGDKSQGRRWSHQALKLPSEVAPRRQGLISPWIREVIRAGRLHSLQCMVLSFSLPSTQDMPIRKYVYLKNNPTAHLRELLLRRKNPCIATLKPHSSQLHTTSFSFSYQHHFVVETVTSLQKEKDRG